VTDVSHHFSSIDVAILVAYIAATLYIGLRHARKNQSLDAYFFADRNIPWWAAGISIVAADTSVVSYIGQPAYVYQKDLQLLVAMLIVLPVIWVTVAVWFIPFLARLHLYTIYQYLERRFGIIARSTASGLFLLLRSGHLALAVYIQALALTPITGIDMSVAVIVCGTVVTLYTVLGGMRAVVWTDVIQFFVTTGGLLVVLGAVLWEFGGNVGTIWKICAEHGHTRLVNMDYNPLIQTTFWWLIIGQALNFLGAYSMDQVLVQRYLSTKSRREMVKAIAVNGMISLPLTICLFGVGLGLTAYYITHPALAATLEVKDQLLLHFVRYELPGLAGLVTAALLAATMSCVSAGINSLSTATTIDFIQRFRRNSAFAEEDVRTAKWISLVWGAVITTGALAFSIGGVKNVVDACITVIGLFTGPLVAMFLLGALTTRAVEKGVLSGAIAGLCVAGIAYWQGVSEFLWGPSGCAVGLTVGYLMSCLFPAPNREAMLPMTVWAAPNEPNDLDLSCRVADPS
jgi:SSS family transporter